ncbi:DUF397 domain-containing protein [Actinospica sp.]|jgi:hypothetical protein|uniref:DUF397 domain-containing protein n=1 Tax=Actinospica sp. TaxID=1872142 RepID=UPI002C187F51|nr:DUF397 domain-containing protein [Actinospica sp.]HWG22831.1 DUF397 domain-containing protein [Actinospica sp.]
MDTTRHIDLHWRKPSTCPNGASCVEIAALPGGGAAIRDGKNRQGSVIKFDAPEWAAFLAAAKAGEFDSPSPDRDQAG